MQRCKKNMKVHKIMAGPPNLGALFMGEFFICIHYHATNDSFVGVVETMHYFEFFIAIVFLGTFHFCFVERCGGGVLTYGWDNGFNFG